MPGHDRAPGSRLPSTLVNRTGIGGAAADRAAQQRGAVEGADTVAVAGGLEGAGVGPELVGRGVELGAAEAAGVADPEVAAVGEADDEPVPGLDVPVGGVLQLLDAGRAVDQQPAGHPEPQAEDGPVVAGVEHDPLAGAAGGEEVPPDEGVGQDVGRQAALQPPGVGGDDLGDLPFKGLFGQPPVGLDLDELWHARPQPRFVIAPREADCTNWAYLARNPLVYLGSFGFQPSRRLAIVASSTRASSLRLGTS